MAEYDNRGLARPDIGGRAERGERIDEGLRSYMLSVYNYMAAGIAVTGVVAYLTFANAIVDGQLTQLGLLIYTSPLKWVIMFAPLGMVLLFAATAHRMSPAMAQLVFWAFAALMGLSLSSIFLRYTGQSITQVFFVTATAFAGLSLYGYTTQKNLSGWGTFLVMGVIGLIVASLINLFIASSALKFAISVIGVLVFAGLTAYDTQRIREVYQYVSHDALAVKSAAINGALSLYLDFINMFLSMLSLFGSSNE